MITTLVSLAIILIAVAMLAFGILYGYKRGFFSSLVHLGAVILAAVIAFFVSKGIGNALSFVAEMITENIPQDLTTIRSVANLVSSACKAAIAVFAFAIVFFIILMLMKIPEFILRKKVLPKTEFKNSRYYAMGVALVSAVIVISMIFLPVSGFVDIADDTITKIEQSENIKQNENYASYEEKYDKYAGPIAKNPVFAVSDFVGGFVFNGLTELEVGDISSPLGYEINIAASAFVHATPLLDTDISEYGTPQSKALVDLADDFGKTRIVANVAGEVVSFAAKQWREGGSFLGSLSPFPEETADITNKLLDVLADSNGDTIKADVKKVAEIVDAFALYGGFDLFKEDADALAIVKRENLVSGILTEIYEYERFRKLTSGVYNYALVIAADKLNVSKESLNQAMISDSDLPELSKDDISAETKKIEDSLFCITDFVSTIDDGKDLLASDLSLLGKGLDIAASSRIIGKSVKPLLEAILKSDLVSESKLLNDDAIEKILSAKGSYENVLASAAKTAQLLKSMESSKSTALTKEEKEEKKEEVKESLGWLAENLDTSTASVLSSIATPDLMVECGVPESSSENLSSFLSDYFSLLADSDELEEEALDKESECIGYLYSLASYDPDSSELIGDTLPEADEMVDMFMNAEVLSGAICDIVYQNDGTTESDPFGVSEYLEEEDIGEIEQAIASYAITNYELSEDQEAFKSTIIAISSLFSIDGENNFDIWIQQ